jgi:hypothetical protein
MIPVSNLQRRMLRIYLTKIWEKSGDYQRSDINDAFVILRHPAKRLLRNLTFKKITQKR